MSSDYYYSTQQQGIDRRTKEFVVQRCLPFLKGSAVLDLGFVDGMWTDRILDLGWESDIVEGAERHVNHARQRYAGNDRVTIHHALFEAFQPSRRYNSIIAGDILRYISEPVTFLRHLKDWLATNGRVILTVPNSRSLHRRIGTLMNMEAHPTDANNRDKEVGNLRSYDRYQLRHELQCAGLRIVELRGCFLKPLSSGQMEGWSDDLLQAFCEIGDELEDYAWFLYAVCEA
ncbi:MAG: class I SAM-dependent methyltransferase [Pyrinomonadaceae bacterium]|nr:class I SAM-dependent methyltransferase [Pyrinomonadaceae bacterium]